MALAAHMAGIGMAGTGLGVCQEAIADLPARVGMTHRMADFG